MQTSTSPLLLYSAAHAGFPDHEPLGGGKAVADYLVREWQATGSYRFQVFSPASLGLLPSRSLADLGEFAYARFCREFERASTAAIRQHHPAECVVLSNDISEGPDFAGLGAKGYRIITIFHVDVVEYFARFYLRNLVRPERLTRWKNHAWLPDVLRLVFQKQLDCVRHSQRIIVPSPPMKTMIRRCYPWYEAERIAVLPWGALETTARFPAGAGRGPSDENASRVSKETSYPEDEFVIVTMSRLSREKGIERLLQAVTHLDNAAGTASRPAPGFSRLRLVICGAAAYMGGKRYTRKLRRLADRINSVRIEFAGHLVGDRKRAVLNRADLFVSPSIHESYGLTIAEAEAAGCPVISHHHYGAAGEVVDCGDPRALAEAMARAVERGRVAKKPVAEVSGPSTAERVAEVCGLPLRHH